MTAGVTDVRPAISCLGMAAHLNARRVGWRERICSHHDQPHLFASTEQGAGGPNLDLNRHKLAGLDALLAEVWMHGLKGFASSRVELAIGHAQPAMCSVAEAEPCDVVEIDEATLCIQLLNCGEQVHVIAAVRFDPQLELEITRQIRIFLEAIREERLRLC